MRGPSASVFLILIILLIVIPPATEAGMGWIHGTLTDSATSEPIAGASVLVVGARWGAITDSNGAFRIRLVDTGMRKVRISHLDYGTVLVPDLLVRPDSSVELSLTLTRISEDAESDIQGIRNTVEKLVESLRHPITNAQGDTFLVLYSLRAAKIAHMVDSVIADAFPNQPVTTVDDLLTQVTGVVTNRNGDKYLRVTRAGEVAYIMDSPSPGPTAGLGRDGAAAQADELGALAGLVIESRTRKGIKGVSVVVVGTEHRTDTDSKGIFEFDSLSAGEYELVFSAKGFETQKRREVIVKADVKSRIGHVLERSRGTGYIQGTLTDSATGEPVTGASVILVGTEQGAMTDSIGRYVINEVESGTYDVTISSSGYWQLTVTNVVVNEDTNTDVSYCLHRNETPELIIELTVKHGSNPVKLRNDPRVHKEAIQGQPVKNLDDSIKVDSVVTDAHGEIFIKGGRAGEIAYVRDGEPLSGGLAQYGATMHIGQSDRVGALLGVVIDAATGKGLKGVSVVVVGTEHRTVSNSNGNFEFDGLSAGKHELLFTREGYKTSKASDVTVRADAKNQFRQVLERAGSSTTTNEKSRRVCTGKICGVVTDSASGEPVIGAQILVVGTKSGALTDVDGAFCLLNIEPGIYEVTISDLDYITTSVPDVIVEAGCRVTLSCKLASSRDVLDTEIIWRGITPVGKEEFLNRMKAPPRTPVPKVQISGGTGSIRGVITDTETGKSIVQATVAVSGTSIGAVTDELGKFKITGVVARDVKLTFSHWLYEDQSVDSITVLDGQTIDIPCKLVPLKEPPPERIAVPD